eukprot:558362-Amphidinium_carterae.1
MVLNSQNLIRQCCAVTGYFSGIRKFGSVHPGCPRRKWRSETNPRKSARHNVGYELLRFLLYRSPNRS